MEPKRVCELLLLDGCNIEIDRRSDPAFRQRDAVVDRVKAACSKNLAGQKLGGNDCRGELLEEWQAIGSHAEQKIRHEYRHETREGAAIVYFHLLEVRIRCPERICRLDKRCSQMIAEDRF